MSYYIIKSGSIQDIKTASEIISKMPDDLNLQYFLLECDENGNVIKEVNPKVSEKIIKKRIQR